MALTYVKRVLDLANGFSHLEDDCTKLKHDKDREGPVSILQTKYMIFFMDIPECIFLIRVTSLRLDDNNKIYMSITKYVRERRVHRKSRNINKDNMKTFNNWQNKVKIIGPIPTKFCKKKI